MVYTKDLKSFGASLAGSSPALGTTKKISVLLVFFVLLEQLANDFVIRYTPHQAIGGAYS